MAMEFLDLYENELSGSLPSELGLLTAMMSLSMSYNELNGTIPSELGLMTAMELVYVSE
jgi:hypothetical protein